MSQELHISANQWRVTMLKACVGTQVARGVAEDVADGCMALLAAGHNPLTPLLEALDSFDPTATPPSWPSNSEPADLGPVQVLHHGPSVIDMAHAGLTCRCEIDNMPLLLGLAQARLPSHGTVLELSADGSNWQGIRGVLRDGRALPDIGSTWLRMSDKLSPQPLKSTELPQPKPVNWAKLQTYADQIMVPADDANRADAGAGLTDND